MFKSCCFLKEIKQCLIFHVNLLLTNDLHEMSRLICAKKENNVTKTLVSSGQCGALKVNHQTKMIRLKSLGQTEIGRIKKWKMGKHSRIVACSLLGLFMLCTGIIG